MRFCWQKVLHAGPLFINKLEVQRIGDLHIRLNKNKKNKKYIYKTYHYYQNMNPSLFLFLMLIRIIDT